MVMESSQYVCRLCDCSKDSLEQVGGKNANLGEMINQGFSVPDGFAVTVMAYQRAMGGVIEDVCSQLEGLCATEMTEVDASSHSIKELIKSVSMPEEIKDSICQHYVELSQKYGVDDLPVAVRSSATAEDLPGASFAGQQDTYLWIRGADNLIEAVINCWASLFTSRAICYRIKQCFEHEKVGISVGVQKMIHPKTAGVMFTINPLNGDRSKITIGGSWGLGESVVSGSVSPDEWMVDKVILEIIKRTIGPKTTMHEVHFGKKTEKVVVSDVPSEKQNIPCLTDDEILKLAKIGKEIERHYGTPQDIEWAIDKDLSFPENMFIVQTRPETVWSGKGKKSVLGARDSVTGQVSSYLTKLKA